MLITTISEKSVCIGLVIVVDVIYAIRLITNELKRQIKLLKFPVITHAMMRCNVIHYHDVTSAYREQPVLYFDAIWSHDHEIEIKPYLLTNCRA